MCRVTGRGSSAAGSQLDSPLGTPSPGPSLALCPTWPGPRGKHRPRTLVHDPSVGRKISGLRVFLMFLQTVLTVFSLRMAAYGPQFLDKFVGGSLYVHVTFLSVTAGKSPCPRTTFLPITGALWAQGPLPGGTGLGRGSRPAFLTHCRDPACGRGQGLPTGPHAVSGGGSPWPWEALRPGAGLWEVWGRGLPAITQPGVVQISSITWGRWMAVGKTRRERVGRQSGMGHRGGASAGAGTARPQTAPSPRGQSNLGSSPGGPGLGLT